MLTSDLKQQEKQIWPQLSCRGVNVEKIVLEEDHLVSETVELKSQQKVFVRILS